MASHAFEETSNVVPILPAIESSDSDDVVVALQTARALQKKGDLSDSVRWLRRAADAAERDGDDRRALALARVAADMTSLIGASGAPVLAKAAPEPISVPPSATSVVQRALPPPPPSMTQRAVRAATAPPSSLPPPLHGRASSAPPSATQSRPQALRKVSPPPLPQEKPSRSDAGSVPPAARSAPRPTPLHSAQPSAPRSTPVAPKPAVRSSQATGRAEEEETPKDLARLLPNWSVVRVSMKGSVTDVSFVVTQKLAPGKALPPGTVEAFLVFAGHDIDPFRGKGEL